MAMAAYYVVPPRVKTWQDWAVEAKKYPIDSTALVVAPQFTDLFPDPENGPSWAPPPSMALAAGKAQSPKKTPTKIVASPPRTFDHLYWGTPASAKRVEDPLLHNYAFDHIPLAHDAHRQYADIVSQPTQLSPQLIIASPKKDKHTPFMPVTNLPTNYPIKSSPAYPFAVGFPAPPPPPPPAPEPAAPVFKYAEYVNNLNSPSPPKDKEEEPPAPVPVPVSPKQKKGPAKSPPPPPPAPIFPSLAQPPAGMYAPPQLWYPDEEPPKASPPKHDPWNRGQPTVSYDAFGQQRAASTTGHVRFDPHYKPSPTAALNEFVARVEDERQPMAFADFYALAPPTPAPKQGKKNKKQQQQDTEMPPAAYAQQQARHKKNASASGPMYQPTQPASAFEARQAAQDAAHWRQAPQQTGVWHTAQPQAGVWHTAQPQTGMWHTQQQSASADPYSDMPELAMPDDGPWASSVQGFGFEHMGTAKKGSKAARALAKFR